MVRVLTNSSPSSPGCLMSQKVYCATIFRLLPFCPCGHHFGISKITGEACYNPIPICFPESSLLQPISFNKAIINHPPGYPQQLPTSISNRISRLILSRLTLSLLKVFQFGKLSYNIFRCATTINIIIGYSPFPDSPLPYPHWVIKNVVRKTITPTQRYSLRVF